MRDIARKIEIISIVLILIGLTGVTAYCGYLTIICAWCSEEIGNSQEVDQYQTIIGDCTRVLDLALPWDEDTSATAFNNRGNAHYYSGQYDRAMQDYNEAVRLKPDSAISLNGKAWFLATVRDPSFRNGREAVRLAQRAVEIAEINDITNLIDTLAAAYAEAGQFERAAAEQKRAIQMLSDKGLTDKIADYQSRLGLYVAGKPYRFR